MVRYVRNKSRSKLRIEVSSDKLFQLHEPLKTKFSFIVLCVPSCESEGVSCSIMSDSLRTQALSMEFSRQEYWSGLSFHPLGDLSDPWTEPRSKSKRVPEKHLFLLYWLCQSLWLCGSQHTVEILKKMGIPDHLTCLLRNLYAGQEATVRTGHGITDWFQIRKGVHQECILSPCLLNSYAEYIMRNSGLDDSQAGIKTARRNINNLRYADETTLT